LEKLASLLKHHADAGTGALVVAGLLDIFTFSLCAPYSETTDSQQFDNLLQIVGGLGRSIFRLFDHPSLAIVKSAGLVMKAIIEEGPPEMCEQMQYFSLAEGALPMHLHRSLFTQSTDNRMLTHRQLSRHLIGLWLAKNPQTMALFKRILPAGLVVSLESKEEVSEKEADRIYIRDNMKAVAGGKGKVAMGKKNLDKLTQHWRTKTRSKGKSKTSVVPVTLRRRRQNLKIEENWDYFYYNFYQDHAKADLIWNMKTREELREALEGEVRMFGDANALRGKTVISWNHTEFEMRYETLAHEVKIGDHYLRLLLEDDPKTTRIHHPQEFFNDLYHRFLLTTVPSMKAMCLQAMAVVYNTCFDKIGAFNDTEYIVTMLNRCEDSMERDRLLEFLFVLLKNKKNVKLFIDANGIRCLVDMVTLAHLHTTRATVPLQSNVIEASASQLAEDDAEWYYSKGKDANGKEEKLGPIGFKAMKELYETGAINKETRVWAQGMEGWKPVRKIAQLKWTLVATGTPLHDFSALCVLCLNMMIRICDMYPTRDKDGAIIRPMPRCKRMLCDQNCLPHLVQLLLTFDPIIVEKTSALLTDIMQDNSQLSRLYLTGAFFFIMMYTGSNVLPIVKFLKDTHMMQAFQNAEGETSRSIIANMLPEAMVCYLDNHDVERFAATYLGEFDTPEAIWGSEMRRYMIRKIALHLSDYTSRLQSNTRAMYQYCPIPKVAYQELDGELFCSIFYLRHLCDETRFPDWPIEDYVQLLKDILDAWTQECEKKPESLSMEECFETLGLAVAPGDAAPAQSKVRKAYFKMSMKYHPDKNPEGRDMFEKVNKAYEFISTKTESSGEGGPQTENLVLILKGQSILFKRFKDGLQPYKYAGYPMLVTTITNETEDENLFSNSVELLAASCELAHLTVACSKLNAEELRRNNGIDALAKALSRCISVIGHKTSDDEVSVKVCTHIARCFTAACFFEGCRERIIELPQITKDICRCLWFEGAPVLTKAAMECVGALSQETFLQNHLLQSGVLWHLMLRLFNYDFTLDESGVEADEATNKQLFFNNHAKMAVVCLAKLGGWTQGQGGTPKNPEIQGAVSAMITPFLADQLAHKDTKRVLKELNSNSETPYLIWDNGTRAELTDFLEKQQEEHIKSGSSDPAFGSKFQFSVFKDELKLAGIFVRIYNDQPTYTLRNPKEFCTGLLNFLGSRAQYIFSQGVMAAEGVKSASAEEDGGDEEAPELTPEQIAEKKAKEMANVMDFTRKAMESLRNVIKNNKGVDKLCNGHFKLIFTLLRYEKDPKLQQLALEVVSSVIGERDCVADIANAKVLVYLLLTTQSLPTGRPMAIEVMHGLMSNPKILAEAFDTGGLLYLLDLYCNSTSPQIRESTSSLLAKMMNEKLRGPRMRIVLTKFLPMIFMDAMRDNPEASVSMFEGTHENPELIWNEDARSKVQSVVSELKLELYASQCADPSTKWSLPADFEVVYENVGDELVVGGVFISLLEKQPNWVFRKPKEFLVAAMESYLKLLQVDRTSKTTTQLEMLTNALCGLFRQQIELVNQVAGLGHLNRVAAMMTKKDEEKQASLLRVCNELAQSATCIRAFSSMEFCKPVRLAMMNCNRSALAPAMEMLSKCVEENNPPLVAQALSSNLIEYMLELLKGDLDTIESAAAAKAHCVKALKAMTKCLTNGDKVNEILNAAPWWKSYKDQRHDLFITSNSTAGYLMGPTSTTAGYLMAAPTTAAMSDAPPDLDAAEDDRARANVLGDD
jgi:DnaJ family protein C protein 13